MPSKQLTLKLIAICAGFISASGLFAQQNTAKFPERAVPMIVPFAPSGSTGIIARLLRDELANALVSNASVMIVNTASAGGFIGMQNTAHAQAAYSRLAYRTGDPFRSFALAEHEKFKQVVKQRNLMEK
jgi:tripartite-type tricarboxylate transporter receptor subunit TctC